jgi:hypothetical protein
MGHNAIGAHTRHYPNHLTSPYFSPALPAPDGSKRFQHLVRDKKRRGTKVYIQAGTAELLWDQAKMLRDGMREEGVDVELREVRFGVDMSSCRNGLTDGQSLRSAGSWRHSRGDPLQPRETTQGDQGGFARVLEWFGLRFRGGGAVVLTFASRNGRRANYATFARKVAQA